MNEDQKQAALGLVRDFVAVHESRDPAYTLAMQSAGDKVQAAILAGQDLHTIETLGTAQMALIVADLRAKLFPGGEVIPIVPVPAPVVPVPVSTPHQSAFADWLYHRALRLPDAVARGLNRFFKVKPGTVQGVNDAVAGTVTTLATGAVESAAQREEDAAAAAVAKTLSEL